MLLVDKLSYLWYNEIYRWMKKLRSLLNISDMLGRKDGNVAVLLLELITG